MLRSLAVGQSIPPNVLRLSCRVSQRSAPTALLDAGRQVTLGTMNLDIDLTPAQADRLRQEAERLKITPEELARAALTDLLSERDQDFNVAAERVLKKYSELYRRLA